MESISYIRDKMAFHESYILPYSVSERRIELRIYVTHRSGVYGYQFAAILWDSERGEHSPIVGSRTGGCGYNKVGHACAEVLGRAAVLAGLETPYGAIYQEADSGCIESALSMYSGLPHESFVWAHG